MSVQMRQYPLLNFTMAKSDAIAAIAKRIFFIAHSPCVSPFCRRSVASWRGPKDFSDATREWVTGQIVRWVNVIRRKNQSLQTWRSKKRRGKVALIWPYRRVSVFPLHSPLSPACAGLSFCCCCPLLSEDGHAHVIGVSALSCEATAAGRLKRAVDHDQPKSISE